MRRRDRTATSGALALCCLALAPLPLSGCDEPPGAAPTISAGAAPTMAAPPPSPPGAVPSQTGIVAGTDQAQAQPSGSTGSTGPVLLNDPSAPSGTPLCGMAARESNALGQALLSRQYAQAGQCATYACYDAATATYIGADGYRHVCR